MSVVLERRLTKEQILELYLNDVSLGQRGSFAIHGVAEAARLFFGKDITNVSLSRSGDDRRRHPVAVAPLAVQQPGAREGAPQRRAPARWPTPGSSAPTRPSAPRGSRCRSSARALEARRRTSSTTSARSCRTSTRRDRRGRRLHHARSAPAAARAGRRARRPRRSVDEMLAQAASVSARRRR